MFLLAWRCLGAQIPGMSQVLTAQPGGLSKTEQDSLCHRHLHKCEMEGEGGRPKGGEGCPVQAPATPRSQALGQWDSEEERTPQGHAHSLRLYLEHRLSGQTWAGGHSPRFSRLAR